MKRRNFLALVGGAALCRSARAQAPRAPRRVGYLTVGQKPDEGAPGPSAFLNDLAKFGYRRGQNLAIEYRYAEWNFDRLPGLAAELVDLHVDIIVAASTPPALAAKAATSTIPIVAQAMGDPVQDGLVASLASPGGNVTGNTFLGPELVAKRWHLLKEAFPAVSRVAALMHPGAYGEQTMQSFLRESEAAARSLGIRHELVSVRSPDELEAAFAVMAKAQAEAMLVLPSSMLFGQYRRIVELAGASRLPAVYQAREFVVAGGLMSYGANLPDLIRRSAAYVDKILRGAKPADLPVEQPTLFEFLINLRTARGLGLTIPPTLLARADEVIE